MWYILSVTRFGGLLNHLTFGNSPLFWTGKIAFGLYDQEEARGPGLPALVCFCHCLSFGSPFGFEAGARQMRRYIFP